MNNWKTYVVDILRDMISFNTVNEPGNEDPLARYIGSELSTFGFEIRIVPCGDRRSSVIAIKGNPNGTKLLFNGHIDVVSVSDNWTRAPFTMTQDGDRLYGRGTADMKGGIASMISAVKRLSDEGFSYTQGQLILTFVADEELYNKGTRSVLEVPEVKNADYAIIGEPTDLNICITHRGTARSIIRLNGRPCHSSKPEAGVNAISYMSHVIQVIDSYNEELKKITHPFLPCPTIAVVMIEGGEKDNIIPGHCEIKFDRRTLPSDTKEGVQKEIQDLMDSLGRQLKDFSYEITPYIYLEAGEVSPDSLVVSKSMKAYETVFGRQAVLRDFSATCEQSLFMNQGIDTLIFGPGHLNQAHVDDEFTSISQLHAAGDFYYTVIKEFLS